MRIREESADVGAVDAVIRDAFAGTAHGDGTEPAIMRGLRAAGAAAVALVAEEDGGIVGQVAFSAVTIDGRPSRWHCLGPVAVRPDRQRRGIGTGLIAHGLDRLRALGSAGCVVLGDPGYYRRFGFRRDPRLTAPGLPAEYFAILAFTDAVPTGAVGFHPAFSAGR